MMRVAVWAVVIGAAVAPVGVAHAAVPEPKADCSMFKKMSDGRWTSTVESRIGNPKSFVTLQPGVPIPRDQTIFGMNISDTIEKLCGKP